MHPPVLDLTGKNILVTGATGAIGAAVARACAGAGAWVIASSRGGDRLRALCAELPVREGGMHALLEADLLQPAGIELLAARLPELDGWVHCAGTARQRLVRQETPEGLAAMLELNLGAPIKLAQALWKTRRFRAGASVVLVGSIAGRSGAAAHGAYAAAKAGLAGWVRCAAIEGRTSRLRFNCLSPGMVRSPMAEAASAALSPEALAAHEAEYPLGFGTPEDVAGPALFLLSDAARWITGSDLVVDGGFTCR